MTLPAHRFRDRAEERKKDKGPPYVHTFDYDQTITAAPEQVARIAMGLKGLGDRIVVLTGSVLSRKELLKQLDDYGFPYDDVVQYDDSQSNGIARAEHLKAFGTWCGFDNRVDRAPLFASVCPHLYVIAEPTKQDKKDAKGSKADAKQVAKEIDT